MYLRASRGISPGQPKQPQFIKYSLHCQRMPPLFPLPLMAPLPAINPLVALVLASRRVPHLMTGNLCGACDNDNRNHSNVKRAPLPSLCLRLSPSCSYQRHLQLFSTIHFHFCARSSNTQKTLSRIAVFSPGNWQKYLSPALSMVLLVEIFHGPGGWAWAWASVRAAAACTKPRAQPQRQQLGLLPLDFAYGEGSVLRCVCVPELSLPNLFSSRTLETQAHACHPLHPSSSLTPQRANKINELRGKPKAKSRF